MDSLEVDMLHLQNAFSKYRQENITEGYLLGEVQRKLAKLWEENKENVATRNRARKFEKNVGVMRKKHHNMKVRCFALRKERNFQMRKCHMYKNQVAELEDKCVKQDKLLFEAHKEIERLDELIAQIGVRDVDQNLGYSHDLENVNPSQTSLQDALVFKCISSLSYPSVHQEELCTQVNGDATVKREPEESDEDHSQDVDDNDFGMYHEHSETSDMGQEPGADRQGATKMEICRNIHRDQLGSSSNESASRDGGNYTGSQRGRGQGFSRTWARKDHTHTIEKPFKCTVDGCGRSFTRKWTLKEHQLTHASERPFVCTVPGCGRNFSQKGTLRSHILMHTSVFTCTVEGCGRTFNRKGNFKQHLLRHTGYTPYECNFEGCGQRFSRNWTLKEHILTHTGEKPYKCSYDGCDRSFSRKWSLKEHIVMHSGEKPFKCNFDGCGQRFSQKGTFRQHVLQHSSNKIFECTIAGCGRKFNRKGNFKQHQFTHTGSRPFECTVDGCGRRFTRNGTLKQHMLLHLESPSHD